MKTQIFFRADGHSKIGLGHVIRSLALADCLKEQFDCKFIIRNPSDSIRTLIEKSCLEIYELPEVLPFQKGEKFTNGDGAPHLSGTTSDIFLQTESVRCTLQNAEPDFDVFQQKKADNCPSRISDHESNFFQQKKVTDCLSQLKSHDTKFQLQTEKLGISSKKVRRTDSVCSPNANSEFSKVRSTDSVCPPKKESLKKEAELLAKTIFKGNEILVLDGYNFDSEYQKILKPHVGKMVCIDDIHSTHFHADVIINHAAGVTENDYSAEAETQFCLGFDYLLLRAPFLKTARSREAPPRVSDQLVSNQQNNITGETPADSTHEAEPRASSSNYFVCLGGADPQNDTIKVLKKAMSEYADGHFFVVIGSAYRFKEALEKLQNQHPKNITILQNLNAEKMVEMMQSCHTAITSPSTVSLEYLAIGGNLFLHQIADNQTRIFNFLTKNKLAFEFEKFGKIEAIDQKTAIANQKAIIDGNSPKRLTNIFRSLSFDLRSNLRRATEYDLMDYFELANESGTREGSFSSESIPLQDHVKWFYQKLDSQNTRMYLLEIDGKFAGQIRFDIAEKATVSYSISPKYRGMGFGKFLLKKGINEFKKTVNSEIEIEGFVKKENMPSNRIFQNLGFHQTETEVLPNAFRYFLEVPVLV